MNQTSEISISPARLLQGELEVASDKSISHRAVVFASLADGTSLIDNFLNAQDCMRTVEAFRAMGVPISVKNKTVEIKGVGLHGLTAPHGALDLGNSGTSMRLLLGLLAGQHFKTILTGDASLSERPMKRVVEPLRQMGAEILGRDGGNFAPLEIIGKPLKAIRFEEKLGSAQVKSAILLAGLFAKGETSVVEHIPCRDHTERMLKQFQAHFRQDKNHLYISGAPLKAQSFTVPGDISSAAFFIVAALLVPNSELLIRHVGLNPTRCGILEVLLKMGAHIELVSIQHGSEPYGDIRIKASHLDGLEISENIPFLIDELPILMIACARARGRSVIRHIRELRVKETDRIQSMADNLKRLGVSVETGEDYMAIEGTDQFRGNVRLTSFGDHRTAMSCAVAGLVAQSDVIVEDLECVQTSFPNFFDQLNQVRG